MSQTAAAVQTQLGNNPMNATIVRSYETDINFDTTHQQWFVVGNCDAPGRNRWCTTNGANNAATQAASILTTLRSSS